MCVCINVTHCRVNALPLLKECMLPFPFFLLPDSVEGVLPLLERLFGVKGHDCFLLCLAFRQILFPQEWIFSVKDGCGTYCVLCITSVEFVCSVGLSRLLTQAR